MAEIKNALGLDVLAASATVGTDRFALWDASDLTWKAITRAELDRALSAWSIETEDFTAAAGGRYACDTSAGALEATVAESLAEGDEIAFSDFAGTWGANALTIDPNGHEFEDLGDGSDPSEPMSCAGVTRFEIVFAGGKLRVRL